MIIVIFLSNVDWSERREDSFENAKNAFSPAVLLRDDYSTSCGNSGTVETPQEQSDEEAHRPPHGKRSASSGNQHTCLTQR
jgi:hypothetical protein